MTTIIKQDDLITSIKDALQFISYYHPLDFIQAVNRAYEDVTGGRREDIVGRSLFAAFDSGPGSDAPENVRQVRASLEKARDTRQRDHLAVVRFSVE